MSEVFTDLLVLIPALMLLLHFVDGSRWSWGENHILVFTLENGTEYALHELVAMYPHALSRFRKELPLDEDRRVCELILSDKDNVIETIAAAFPPQLHVCEDHLIDLGDVLVEDEDFHGYFPTFGCSICKTDHTQSMEEIDWQDVAEDIAFESYREDLLMSRGEGE